MKIKLLLPLLLLSTSAMHASGLDSNSTAIKKSRPTSKRTHMEESTLPFQLKASDIPKIRISYLYHSQKLNSCFQEIILTGSGTLQLKKNLSLDEKPEVKEGKIGTKEIITLLSSMEENTFLNHANEYGTQSTEHGYRKISLTLPNLSKDIILFDNGCGLVDQICAEFEMVAGAIKIIAGLNMPEALNHDFFPDL